MASEQQGYEGDCQRCGNAPATGHFKLGANNESPIYSTWNICDGCTQSLGEWFDEQQSRDNRVVIVQCTGSKRDGEHPARDLYDESDYFRKQRDYARAVSDYWFIQSALYGLLRPDDVVESYDRHAKDIDDADEWASEIADDLSAAVPENSVVEVLGGKRYADPLRPELEKRGFEVHEPLRGQRIGKRRQSLAKMATAELEASA